jgi:hypothetical protein
MYGCMYVHVRHVYMYGYMCTCMDVCMCTHSLLGFSQVGGIVPADHDLFQSCPLPILMCACLCVRLYVHAIAPESVDDVRGSLSICPCKSCFSLTLDVFMYLCLPVSLCVCTVCMCARTVDLESSHVWGIIIIIIMPCRS